MVYTIVPAAGYKAAEVANVDNLLYGAKVVIEALSDAGTPERTQLTGAWRAALDRLGTDAAAPLSGPEQLNVVRARMLLARLDAPAAALPPALLDEARATVARITSSHHCCDCGVCFP